MKKLFAVLFLAVLVPGLAWASPFVVCDPYPAASLQPDGFAVSVDGGADYCSISGRMLCSGMGFLFQRLHAEE